LGHRPRKAPHPVRFRPVLKIRTFRYFAGSDHAFSGMVFGLEPPNSPAQHPRIAIVQRGDPTRAGSWSGVPVGLISGFRAACCEVVPVNAEFRAAGGLARE